MRRPPSLPLAPAMLAALLGLPPGVLAGTADPADLERAWHGCLREASAHQPSGQSRAGDQRNALDACKEREDAYVAAVMAAQPGRGERGLGVRAMGWAASVAASVLDPVTAWLRGLGR